MTTKITEGSDTGSSQINQTPGLFGKKKNISNSQSKQFNKEKANKNEPLDIQGKATHQLIVKPIYPGLQLKLSSILKKKKRQPHGIKSRFTLNSITKGHQLNFHLYIYIFRIVVMNFEFFKNNPEVLTFSLFFYAWNTTKIQLVQLVQFLRKQYKLLVRK